jgi:hypothetical protein
MPEAVILYNGIAEENVHFNGTISSWPGGYYLVK